MEADDEATVRAWLAGIARFRRVFSDAGIRRCAPSANAMLGLAALIWRECRRVSEDFVDIASQARRHAGAEKHVLFPRTVRRFSVNEKLLDRMRKVAGPLGHFEALMLCTMAVEDLWRFCAITAVQGNAAARGAIDYAERRAAAIRIAQGRGTMSTGGGDA